MKIAMINSFYSRKYPSGENEVFTQLSRVLKYSGVKIEEIIVETDIRSRQSFYRLRCAINEIFGWGGLDPRVQLGKRELDLIHINNLFPNFERKSTELIKIPKILTLHNYRSVCVAGTLSRGGTYCDLCSVNPVNSLKYRCYRNSFMATFPLFLSRLLKQQIRFIQKMDLVVVPSKRSLEIFTKFGIANNKWRVIPHGIAPGSKVIAAERGKFVFVGRLSLEKGLDRILRSWPTDILLDIVGDGDFDTEPYKSSENINFLGRQPREFVVDNLGKYSGLVFASSAPESALPLVALEALASGLPIISVEGNTVSDAIFEGEFGLVLTKNFDKQDLDLALRQVMKEFPKLSARALKYVQLHHSEEIWVSNYYSAYIEAIKNWKLKDADLR